MAPVITIQALLTLDEMYAAVELQQSYWGTDLESVVPAHMLYSMATSGGHVLAAFDRDRMIGVLMGFIGTRPHAAGPARDHLQVVSKRMVVLDAYRGHGVGYRLKLAQREQTLALGIPLVTWTFDPLLAPNAHLNLHKLGGVSRRYLYDYYGSRQTGGLARLGHSDRLLVEWWVGSRHVRARLNGEQSQSLESLCEQGTPVCNANWTPGQPIQELLEEAAHSNVLLMQMPSTLEDQQAEIAWRGALRAWMPALFEAGFVAVDVVRGRQAAAYLLTRSSDDLDELDENEEQ